jgi:hypothetical protein
MALTAGDGANDQPNDETSDAIFITASDGYAFLLFR